MTLTLYSAHLLGLAGEVHYDQSYRWFLVHLGAAVLFTVTWREFLGQGPWERLVARAVNTIRRMGLSTGHGTPLPFRGH